MFYNLAIFPQVLDLSQNSRTGTGPVSNQKICFCPIYSHLNVEVTLNNLFSAISYLWQGMVVKTHMLITESL